jgi:hypothetical protein
MAQNVREVPDSHKRLYGVRTWRYFLEIICKKGIKPTGKLNPDPLVANAMKVWAGILRMQSMASLGAKDSTDNDDDDPSKDEGDDE